MLKHMNWKATGNWYLKKCILDEFTEAELKRDDSILQSDTEKKMKQNHKLYESSTVGTRKGNICQVNEIMQ